MKNYNSLKVLIPLIAVFIIGYFIKHTVEDDLLPVSKLDNVVWIVKFVENEPPISQPRVYNSSLYIQTKTEILVYNMSTGRLAWKSQIPLEETKFGSPPPLPMLIDQFRIVAQSQRTMISVFDKETGHLFWNTNDPSAAPFVEDMILEGGKLIVSSYDSNISAYDIADGKFVWSNTVPSRTELKLFPFEQKIMLETLNALVSHDANNGQTLQSYKLRGDVDSYLLDGDRLYMVFDSGDCTFSSLNLETMEYDWCTKVSFDFLLNNMEMILDNDNIYVFGSKMYGINKKTGAVLWETSPQDFFISPTIIEDFIYVTDSGYLSVINKNTGSKIAKINTREYYVNNTDSKLATITTSDLILVFDGNRLVAYTNPIK